MWEVGLASSPVSRLSVVQRNSPTKLTGEDARATLGAFLVASGCDCIQLETTGCPSRGEPVVSNWLLPGGRLRFNAASHTRARDLQIGVSPIVVAIIVLIVVSGSCGCG